MTSLRPAGAAAADRLAILQLLDTLPPFRCAQGRQENWDRPRRRGPGGLCAAAEQVRLDLLEAVRRAVLGDLVARLASSRWPPPRSGGVEGRLTFHDLLVHARRLFATRATVLDRAAARATAGCSSTSSRTPTPSRSNWRPAWRPPSMTADVGGRPTRRAVRRGRSEAVDLPLPAGRRRSLRQGQRRDRSTEMLHTNFRSVPGIVDFVNVVFDEIFGDGTVAGQAPHHALQAARPAPPVDPSARRAAGGEPTTCGPCSSPSSGPRAQTSPTGTPASTPVAPAPVRHPRQRPGRFDIRGAAPGRSRTRRPPSTTSWAGGGMWRTPRRAPGGRPASPTSPS